MTQLRASEGPQESGPGYTHPEIQVLPFSPGLDCSTHVCSSHQCVRVKAGPRCGLWQPFSKSTIVIKVPGEGLLPVKLRGKLQQSPVKVLKYVEPSGIVFVLKVEEKIA